MWVYLHDMNTCIIPDTTNGTAIYAYIDPQNHPNLGTYMAHMECLGMVLQLGRYCSRLGRLGNPKQLASGVVEYLFSG